MTTANEAIFSGLTPLEPAEEPLHRGVADLVCGQVYPGTRPRLKCTALLGAVTVGCSAGVARAQPARAQRSTAQPTCKLSSAADSSAG
ncbi:unnamed protein product, partial [Iphiclides podalirius]